MDLATCSEIQYEVKEGIHGVAYSHDGERDWTPVVGKKKKSCIPDFIKRRYPADQPFNSPKSDGSQYRCPYGANVDVQFEMADTPGLC